jgi:alpha-mannosidase
MKKQRTRRPLYFTFGNHMHWVDMQWLWGYHVLPGCVRDMLHLIKETGAKGNVNFDGIGYEKMAAECPEALADLRAAVKRGDVEPVGCSYGQPYGLFQGGESNIRQFTYGVRSVMRLLGVRPASFWEEEFYFYPQLPQVLKGCGFTGACLYFQWTWHTPEVPKEATSLIMWEGIDGTRLPTLPRNDLNLHQWPEDFEGVLDKVAAMPETALTPAIVQWLELMPSKDWMCRSEVLLPRLKELMGDRRFNVRAGTVSDLIRELRDEGTARQSDGGEELIPVRRYTMDDVWHGMTLGKNGDAHPRRSMSAEGTLRLAEAAAATASLFGRPYASWDVYPTWELEEAWRECLAAQHHDNHECEGLCGFVGHRQFWNSIAGAMEVVDRTSWLLSRRAGLRSAAALTLNSVGWDRPVEGEHVQTGEASTYVECPPFGYAAGRPGKPGPRATVKRTRGSYVLSRKGLSCEVDRKTGTITRIVAGGVVIEGAALAGVCIGAGDAKADGRAFRIEVLDDEDGECIGIGRAVPGGGVRMYISLAPEVQGVDVWMQHLASDDLSDPLRPEPGLGRSLQVSFKPGWAKPRCVADAPLSAEEVRGSGDVRRKYPEGDWMTSPQWFETLRDPFTASTFVDLLGEVDGTGLLICHDGSQQWFRDDDGVRVVATAYDPWDEGRYTASGAGGCHFRLIPHGTMSHAERRRAAMQRLAVCPDLRSNAQPVGGGTADGVEADIPRTFGPLEVVGAPNVLAHAFFRESMKNGEHLPDWAGHRMFEESDGACDHPFVIRLVEWNGEPARVRLKLAGKVAMAAKTNLMGEVEEGTKASRHRGIEAETRWLSVKHPVAPPWWGKDKNGKAVKFRGKGITWSEVEFDMRPREIATIYADMVMGRKEFRDLDAKRKVWATVHKTKASPKRKRGKNAPR